MKFTSEEIAAVVEARLRAEYPEAVFDCGPEAPHKRMNQQEGAPGGRVVMLPGSIAPGTRILHSLEDEVRADLEIWDFECFGYSEDPEAKWINHYGRAERLGDTVGRAFFPFTTRIKFVGGKPGGAKQSPTVGALRIVSYAVLRPIGAWTQAAAVSVDGGTPDIAKNLLSDFTTSIQVTR